MPSTGALFVYSEAPSILPINGGLHPDAVLGNLPCRTLDVESTGSFAAAPVGQQHPQDAAVCVSLCPRAPVATERALVQG